MPPVSHQTIRLGKGKHTSPEHGACVMELASMLGDEHFTDHPRSVSRTIAALLRGYNDLVGPRRRQDLYRYAALCVGTAGDWGLEEARIRHLIGWAQARRERRSVLRWPRAGARHCAIAPEAAANYALRVLVRSSASHADVLALVDELIALGHPGPALAATPTLSGCGTQGLEFSALSQLR